MSDAENPASGPVNEKKSSFDSMLSLLGRIGPGLRVSKMFLVKNWKASTSVAVFMAVVATILSTHNSGSSKPSDTPTLLSSYHAKSWWQGVNDQTKYDLGIRMDPQIRDCSSKAHWKKTFSDLDYSLLGYDILFGYPLANGRDPGFRHPIFMANFSKPKQTSDCRYMIPQGFTVIPSESCVVSFESKLIRNKQQMSSHLGVQASVKGGGWGFEFSASAGYKRDSAEMSSGEYLFVISQAGCQNYYSMIDFTNPPPFDPGFISKAKSLADPRATNEAVLEFIEYFGTHFFTEVTYGAKFVQHHKMSQSTYEKLKKSSINVEAQASYSGLFSIGGGFSLDKEQSEAASAFSKSVETTTYTVGSTPPSNGDAMTWAASVDQNPVPMLYALAAIDTLFTEPFIKDLPRGFDYNVAREKLKNASQLFCQDIKGKGMIHSCDARFELKSEGLDIHEEGYSYLQNIDNATCLAFCRQDENCTSVAYSELHPPFTSSACRFFNTRDTNLTAIHPAILNPRRKTYLVILESRGNGFYYNSALEGRPFKEYNTSNGQSWCDWDCYHANKFFCDAYSFKDITGTCSLYSARDITAIVLSDKSIVKM